MKKLILLTITIACFTSCSTTHYGAGKMNTPGKRQCVIAKHNTIAKGLTFN